MMTKLLLEYALFAQLLVGLGALVIMWRRRLTKKFFSMFAFLLTLSIETIFSMGTLFFRKELGLSKYVCYSIYFYSHWVCFFLEYGLFLVIIYSVFRKAMKPLRGLKRAGEVIFRWIAGASLAVSFCVALTPYNSVDAYARFAHQLEQAMSVLMLCLLLFVCFAIRHLGLTYRSHIFGISLGLGLWAAFSMVQSALLATQSYVSLYSPIYFVGALGACSSLLIWGIYFAMPEPKRRMVLLPTTSPYFHWNRVAEALGNDPGQVVVSGFKPEMLADAELTVMKAASRQVQARKAASAAMEAAAGDVAAALQRIAMPR